MAVIIHIIAVIFIIAFFLSLIIITFTTPLFLSGGESDYYQDKSNNKNDSNNVTYMTANNCFNTIILNFLNNIIDIDKVMNPKIAKAIIGNCMVIVLKNVSCKQKN